MTSVTFCATWLIGHDFVNYSSPGRTVTSASSHELVGQSGPRIYRKIRVRSNRRLPSAIRRKTPRRQERRDPDEGERSSRCHAKECRRVGEADIDVERTAQQKGICLC